ncbi:long-chain fatty acid--CoA ligase [Olivibacter ginsenosidimutans]|uniref:Long-chain fatty acid--CoA ligase n=1 Tax=Olivibacter ginsenosidimutans TaxID=1176537 RepID=A0ABP9BW24_9SPHI
MADIIRVFDLLPHYKSTYKQKTMVVGKVDGNWKALETEDCLRIVDNLSRGLIDLGIKKGDKIAIMSGNRPEWNFLDFAVSQIGAATVPLYPTLSDHDLNYILEDADIKIAFVGTADLYEKIKNVLQQKHPDAPVYSFSKVSKVKHWEEIEKNGASLSIDLENYRHAVTADDLLTLIYTSGTTGNPKGVFLSHRNLITNFTDCAHLLPDNYKTAISFLPLSHIFERMVIYLYFYKGVTIYYAENMDMIVDDINAVKPNGFTTVPRVLEKIYDKIVEKGKSLSGLKKGIFFWALQVGLRFKEPERQTLFYRLKLLLARILVFKQWQAALGGNIVGIISGGAALQERLSRVFWAAGIPVLEGYGLTETSPVIAVNSFEPRGLRFGSVGKVLKSVKVKIAADGEVLCKGPSVTKGYYKNEKATAEAFDNDGYLKTGDIGELSADGFLRITDRKKEMFKTAGGKYVAPQPIENKLMESTLIAQVMVIGEGKRFPAALIVPSFEELKKWAKRKGMPQVAPNDLVKKQEVQHKYQQILDQANTNFGHWEQIKKFALLTDEWSIDGGELTPKLSLKRKVILEKNKNRIEEIYGKEEDSAEDNQQETKK